MATNEAENLTPKIEKKFDIQELMAEIRQKVTHNLEEMKDDRPDFLTYQAKLNAEDGPKAGELLKSPDLLTINQLFAKDTITTNTHIQSHRGGVLGKIIDKCKRKLHATVIGMLDNYFSGEKEFKAHLVRHLNQTAKYVDGRDMANFWELIRKIDYDVQKALDRIERIHDEQMGSLHAQEKRVNERVQNGVAELEAKVAKHQAALDTLEGVARGLEGIVARTSLSSLSLSNASEKTKSSTDSNEATDHSYLLLENRFRGSEDRIKERMKIYPPYFTDTTLPILEIGQGRGELLELFKENKLTAYGVDLDKGMSEVAAQKGLDVKLGDGIAHLRSLRDNTLGGVIAIQVVEHLTQQQLEELFTLCNQKVSSGGKIIFETINPRSLLALSSNYFRDPTHIWPLHPDTLEYTMNLCGLKTVSTQYLSPVEREAQLREVPVEEFMSPRWGHAIETINRNFEQLNALIYGMQDYCIIAQAE